MSVFKYSPRIGHDSVQKYSWERLVPRVFKYLLDLKDDKENREHLKTKALKEDPVPGRFCKL